MFKVKQLWSCDQSWMQTNLGFLLIHTRLHHLVLLTAMVSLQSVGQPGGGVTFFSDNLNVHHDDEPLLGSMPVIPREPASSRWVAEEMKKFRRIRTPTAIVLAKVLYVCLGLAAYLVPVFCMDGKCGVQEATSLVTYIHGGMWFVLALVHLYLEHEHRNSLLHGYFNFHLETRTLRKASLFINTGANVVMLVMSRVLEALCDTEKSCPLMSMVRYYQVLVTVEVVIALVVLLVYLVKTLRFNRAKQVPDFLRSPASLPASQPQREIGFRLCGCGEDGRRATMTLMWYEVLFWKRLRVQLCLDVLRLNDAVQSLEQRHIAGAPFDLQTWAMGQCWEEVYQLRQRCRNLLEEKHDLQQRWKDHGLTIN